MRADALSKLAAAEEEDRVGIMFEIRSAPSVPRQTVNAINELDDADWRKPIVEYLVSGAAINVSTDVIRRRASRYILIDDVLFKKIILGTILEMLRAQRS